MSASPLRIFRSVKEFVPRDSLSLSIPRKIRGIYVLFEKRGPMEFRVVYIGRSEKSVNGRIRDHDRKKEAFGKWDHFSVFQVHENISDAEIRELESLILFIYRKDFRVNILNTQRSAKTFRLIRRVQMVASTCLPA